MKSKLTSAILIAELLPMLFSCNCKKVETTSENPSALLTDKQKIDMVHSLKVTVPDKLLEMDYTADYKLDELLEADASTYEKLLQFFADKLLDVQPGPDMNIGVNAGCSAYAAENPENGERWMGRNYDFCHVEDSVEVPITAMMVKTAPKNGKKSISMVDAYWLGYHKGFYNDGKSDLSMLVAAPYTILDGMNEDGFAICVLHLGGNPAMQKDPEKKSLWCNVVMRVLLDKCGSVDEALEFIKNYNVTMENPAAGSDHFFLADASGNYAILEYTYKEDEPITEESYPDKMIALQGEDFSYVTNFYVDPALKDNAEFGGLATRGKARYEILQKTLVANAYKLTPEQARKLLEDVSTASNPAENTSHTQWSALYNLSQRTMSLTLLQEFEQVFSYSLE